MDRPIITLPVCLNSLIYKYERGSGVGWRRLLGKPAEAAKWNVAAATRKVAIDKYLWNAGKGMYFDYDYEKGEQSSYNYIATFYPLWAGAADATQIAGVERTPQAAGAAGRLRDERYELRRAV